MFMVKTTSDWQLNLWPAGAGLSKPAQADRPANGQKFCKGSVKLVSCFSVLRLRVVKVAEDWIVALAMEFLLAWLPWASRSV
jgi:hypothetical protein